MGPTMSQRRAVSKAIATRYKCADKAAKRVILDELCARTGWHRIMDLPTPSAWSTESRVARLACAPTTAHAIR